MTEPDPQIGLFPALLKFWRGQRGMSQLDLSVAADVSSRHISFLERGRSRPSPEMVVQLGATLSVPLRHVNAMLDAAGHEPVYEDADDPVPASLEGPITMLKDHHEPFPLIVVDRVYTVLDANGGALALMANLIGIDPSVLAVVSPAELNLNLARLTFDPDGVHRFVANFDVAGRELLWRIQREALADSSDARLAGLLEDLLAMPTVDPEWRVPDLSMTSDPALVLHLRTDELDLRFLTTITAFQAPQNVAVEDLRVETWFPYDEATAEQCRQLPPVPSAGGP